VFHKISNVELDFSIFPAWTPSVTQIS